MRRSATNAVLVIGVAVSLAGCGGSGAGPTPPTPPVKTFNATGTLTMTSSAEADGNHYTASIQLSEHGGLGASMGDVDFSYNVGATPYATVSFGSAQVWLGGTRLNALNNLGSNFLSAIDSAPAAIPDTAVATLHYTDDNQKIGTLTLTASIPAPPGPPPGARFTLTGTVLESPGNFAVRDATVEVTTGATAGHSARTDGNGRYTLSDVAGGVVTIRASKKEYDTVDHTINLTADGALNFTLKKSVKVLPTTAATPTSSRAHALKVLRGVVE